MEHPEIIETGLNVDYDSKTYLSEAAKWARFLGILGFIGSGFLLILSLIIIIGGSSAMMSNAFSQGLNLPESGMIGFIGFIYLIVAAISFFTALVTYRFGTRTLRAVSFENQTDFQSGTANLRMLFRIYGILAIIYIGFIGLAIIFGIVGALFIR